MKNIWKWKIIMKKRKGRYAEKEKKEEKIYEYDFMFRICMYKDLCGFI